MNTPFWSPSYIYFSFHIFFLWGEIDQKEPRKQITAPGEERFYSDGMQESFSTVHVGKTSFNTPIWSFSYTCFSFHLKQ